MNYFKASILFVFLIFTEQISAQVPALGGGLTFSTGIDVNGLSTGNPGIYAKAYFKLGKQFKIVPSLSAFSPKKRAYPAYAATLRNYMFLGDLDAHYSVYHDKPIRVIIFSGINTTAVISKWELDQNIGQNVKDENKISPGINLGGAIYMFVNNSFDAFIAGKYIAGNLNHAVINIGIIYYPEGLRRRGGW